MNKPLQPETFLARFWRFYIARRGFFLLVFFFICTGVLVALLRLGIMCDLTGHRLHSGSGGICTPASWYFTIPFSAFFGFLGACILLGQLEYLKDSWQSKAESDDDKADDDKDANE